MLRFEPTAVAIVLVTYNRAILLERNLKSITQMDPKPGKVIVVDNDSSDNTQEVIVEYSQKLNGILVNALQQENTGGAGGFSAGMKIAYESGAEWIWMMDDDVEVIPDALTKLSGWTDRFKHIQGRRYDYDGSEYYWQPRISVPFGIPYLPWAPAGFEKTDHRLMNSGCFEGMFIHRSVVKEIGLPDYRFFIAWDDALYGWLASTVTQGVAVKDIVLRRTRDIKQLNMGSRQLNASSDFYRYYIMRNRGYMVQYYRHHGVHNPFLFGIGTFLTFIKEHIRIWIVERKFGGTGNLWKGWRESRRIMKDKSWQPMPKLGD